LRLAVPSIIPPTLHDVLLSYTTYVEIGDCASLPLGYSKFMIQMTLQNSVQYQLSCNFDIRYHFILGSTWLLRMCLFS